MAKAAVEMTTETPKQRSVPAIKPSDVQNNNETSMAWNEWMVRLPKGVIAQDLQDHPDVWKLVMAAKPIKRHDKVYCIAFDEAWTIETRVSHADGTKVVLAFRPGDIRQLSTQAAEWEDELYAVRWAGNGYAAFRKSDNVRVIPQSFATVAAAQMEVHRTQYAKRVA